MKPENTPVPIAKPCPKAWEGMAGTDKKRFCEVCQLHVYNLSLMTTKERTALLSRPGGAPCIAYELRPDGSMVTLSRWSKLPFYRAGLSAAAALAAAFPMLFSACSSTRRLTGAPMPPAGESGKNPIPKGKYNSAGENHSPKTSSAVPMLGTPAVEPFRTGGQPPP